MFFYVLGWIDVPVVNEASIIKGSGRIIEEAVR